jgi:hypothetical protein
MLHNIDVLIGLSVVMLSLSMAVTIVTQTILDGINHRAKALKDGLAELLKLLDVTIDATAAKEIAVLVLNNELLTRPWLGFLPWRRPASTIHREEFTKLLLGIADPTPPAAGQEPTSAQKLHASLVANGIAAPGPTLDAIRLASVQIEKTNPEMSNSARANQAILQHAESAFIAKLNGWFDQTIDRVVDRFTASARLITVIAAAVVAISLQVDTVDLVNRLSTDDKARAALVTHAQKNLEALKPGEVPDKQWREKLNQAAGTELIPLPDYSDFEEAADLQEWLVTFFSKITFGVLLTIALLSLGAPFWYELLKNLLRLRSLVSAKDDTERKERQTSQTNTAATTVVVANPGERGDLNAIG